MSHESKSAKRTALPAAERKAFPLPEAISYLGAGRSTLYKLLAPGRLSSVKIGRRRLILRADLDALLTGEEA